MLKVRLNVTKSTMRKPQFKVSGGGQVSVNMPPSNPNHKVVDGHVVSAKKPEAPSQAGKVSQ